MKNEKKQKIKNMTPHGVNIIINGEVVKTFPSEGVIRLSQSTIRTGAIGDVPISETSFGGVQLPEEKEDTYYIVSSLVCQACPGRNDLLIVNETIRDESGRITGCQSLSRNPFYKGFGGGSQ